MTNEKKWRIESELEIRAYIQNLKYALKNGAKIEIQAKRRVDDVYIKIRVEVLGLNGQNTIFIMSFHFAEKTFAPNVFPYKKS